MSQTKGSSKKNFSRVTPYPSEEEKSLNEAIETLGMIANNQVEESINFQSDQLNENEDGNENADEFSKKKTTTDFSNSNHDDILNFNREKIEKFEHDFIDIKEVGLETEGIPLNLKEEHEIKINLNPFILDVQIMLAIVNCKKDIWNYKSDKKKRFKGFLTRLEGLVLYYRGVTGFSKFEDINYFIKDALYEIESSEEPYRLPFKKMARDFKAEIDKVDKDLLFKKIFEYKPGEANEKFKGYFKEAVNEINDYYKRNGFMEKGKNLAFIKSMEDYFLQIKNKTKKDEMNKGDNNIDEEIGCINIAKEKFNDFYAKYDQGEAIRSLKKNTQKTMNKNSNAYKFFEQELNIYQSSYFQTYCKEIKNELENKYKNSKVDCPTDKNMNFGKFVKLLKPKNSNSSSDHRFLYVSQLQKLIITEDECISQLKLKSTKIMSNNLRKGSIEITPISKEANVEPESNEDYFNKSESCFRTKIEDLKIKSNVTLLTCTKDGTVIVLVNQKNQLSIFMKKIDEDYYKKDAFFSNRKINTVLIYENPDKTYKIYEAGEDSNIQVYENKLDKDGFDFKKTIPFKLDPQYHRSVDSVTCIALYIHKKTKTLAISNRDFLICYKNKLSPLISKQFNNIISIDYFKDGNIAVLDEKSLIVLDNVLKVTKIKIDTKSCFFMKTISVLNKFGIIMASKGDEDTKVNIHIWRLIEGKFKQTQMEFNLESNVRPQIDFVETEESSDTSILLLIYEDGKALNVCSFKDNFNVIQENKHSFKDSRRCTDLAFFKGNSVYVYNNNVFDIHIFEDRDSHSFSNSYKLNAQDEFTNLKKKIENFCKFMKKLEKRLEREKTGKYKEEGEKEDWNFKDEGDEEEKQNRASLYFVDYLYSTYTVFGIGHSVDCIKRNSICYRDSQKLYALYKKLYEALLELNTIDREMTLHLQNLNKTLKSSKSSDFGFSIFFDYLPLSGYSLNCKKHIDQMEKLIKIIGSNDYNYSLCQHMKSFANEVTTLFEYTDPMMTSVKEIKLHLNLLNKFSQYIEKFLDQGLYWCEKYLTFKGVNKENEEMSLSILADLAENLLNYDKDSYPKVFFVEKNSVAIITPYLSTLQLTFQKKGDQLQFTDNKIKECNDSFLLKHEIKTSILGGSEFELVPDDDRKKDKYFIQFKNGGNKIKLNSKISVLALDEKRLVLALINHQLLIIDIKEKKILKKLYPHCMQILCLAISPNSEIIATGSDDESLKVFDSTHGKFLLSIKYHSGSVISLEFHPNNKFILASFVMIRDSPLIYKIHMFSLINSECVINFEMKVSTDILYYMNPIKPFLRLSFMSADKILVNSLEDKPMVLDYFSITKPKIEKKFGGVNSICFAREKKIGKFCFLGGTSSRLEILPLLNGQTENHLEPSDTVNCIDVSEERQGIFQIAVGFESGILQLFQNVENKENKKPRLQKYEDRKLDESIYCVSFSEDIQILVVGLLNGKIQLLILPLTTNQKEDLGENSIEQKSIIYYTFTMHGNYVIADLEVAKLKNSKKNYYEFITGSYDKTVKLSSISLDCNNEDQISDVIINQMKVYQGNHKRSVFTVAWSKDCTMFLSGGEDKLIFVYDRNSFSIIKSIYNHDGSVWNAQFFSNDGRQVLSSGEDKCLIISDSYSGKLLHKVHIEKGSDVWDFAHIPEYDRLIATNDVGLFDICPFYNTSERLMRMRNILEQKYVPIKFPDDICILPFPLKMTRLQYAVGINDIKYIDDVYTYFKQKRSEDELFVSYIFPFIYNEDMNGLDAWDYCKRYSAQYRDRIRRTLLKLHLLMSPRQRRFLYTVRSKSKLQIIKLTKKYYPDKLFKLFETFFSSPFYMNVNKELNTHNDVDTKIFLSHPMVNAEIINKELLKIEKISVMEFKADLDTSKHDTDPYYRANSENKEKDKPKDNLNDDMKQTLTHVTTGNMKDEQNKKLTDKLKEKLKESIKKKPDNVKKVLNPDTINAKVTTFQIRFSDLDYLFKILNGIDLEAEIFSSEKLAAIMSFYWETKYSLWFRVSFIFYLGYMISVCLLVLYSFINRVEDMKEHCINERDLLATTLQVIVLTILTLFSFRELFQIIFTNQDTLMQKLYYHFLSIWNIMDTFMIISGFYSIYLDYTNGPGLICNSKETWETLKFMYSIFLFLTWVRLLDFARGIKTLSSLIRLFARVTHDMLGFLLVLFYLIVGLSIMSKEILF